MSNPRKFTVKIFIWYFALLIINGIVKVNMIVNQLPSENPLALKYVSIFSVVIGVGITAVILIVIAVSTYLITYIFNLKITTDDLIISWGNLIFTYVFFEVIKITLLWVLFSSDIKNLSLNNINELKDYLSALSYTKVTRMITEGTMYLSIIIFAISLYLRNKKEIIEVAGISIFILLLNVALYYKIL